MTKNVKIIGIVLKNVKVFYDFSCFSLSVAVCVVVSVFFTARPAIGGTQDAEVAKVFLVDKCKPMRNQRMN